MAGWGSARPLWSSASVRADFLNVVVEIMHKS